jgi:hypothetical protein
VSQPLVVVAAEWIVLHTHAAELKHSILEVQGAVDMLRMFAAHPYMAATPIRAGVVSATPEGPSNLAATLRWSHQLPKLQPL